MTVQAILSDVHGNVEALTAVKDHMDSLGRIDEVIVIGDLVGYGPNPVECICLAQKMGAQFTMGNHELGLFQSIDGFNKYAKAAAMWTRAVIQEHKQEPMVYHYLKNLPDEIRTDQAVFTHGSLRGSTAEYLIKRDDLLELTPAARESMKINFDLIDHIGFTGHTHIPYVCNDDYYLVPPEWNDYEPYEIFGNTKTLVNVGSVGQPRDHDPRACYAIYDGYTIRHYRVEYDIQAVVDKIKQIPEIDDRLGGRLTRGR
jgi:diadenosine tetraphosphatase ApaH/serine/threonine PP2A family protein phosphatase